MVELMSSPLKSQVISEFSHDCLCSNNKNVLTYFVFVFMKWQKALKETQVCSKKYSCIDIHLK